MNGRIYDPLLGRFLSADVVVQFPGSLQSYNRYSYVRNNPLTAADPSGFLESYDEMRNRVNERENQSLLGGRITTSTSTAAADPTRNAPEKSNQTAAGDAAQNSAKTAQTTTTPNSDAKLPKEAPKTPGKVDDSVDHKSSSTSTSTAAASPTDVSTTRSSASTLTASSTNGDSLNPALTKVAQTGIYVGAGVLEKTATIGEMANMMAGTTIGIVGAGLDLIPPKAGAFLSDFGKYGSQLKTGIDSIDDKVALTTNGMRLLGNTSKYGAQLRDFGFSEANNASARFNYYLVGHWSDQFSPFNK